MSMTDKDAPDNEETAEMLELEQIEKAKEDEAKASRQEKDGEINKPG